MVYCCMLQCSAVMVLLYVQCSAVMVLLYVQCSAVMVLLYVAVQCCDGAAVCCSAVL